MAENKFLGKAKEFLFKGEDGKNAIDNVKDWVKGDKPIMEAKTEEEKADLNKDLTKAQEGRAAETQRLATTQTAVKEGIAPEEAAKKTGENLAETQAKITGPNDVTDKAETAIEAFDDNEKEDIENEITSTTGGTTPETPEDAEETLLNYATKNGLVTINEDGTIDFAKLKTTPKSVISRIGSVLSALLTMASGGAIPPVNFYRLSNAEQEDQARLKLYDDLMNNIAKEQGAVGADKVRAGQSKEDAEEAGYRRFMASGEGARAQKELEALGKKMAMSTEGQKELADYMAKISANQVPNMYRAMKDAGMTEKDIRDTVRAFSGQLPSWTEYLKMGTGAIKDVAGAFRGGAGK